MKRLVNLLQSLIRGRVPVIRKLEDYEVVFEGDYFRYPDAKEQYNREWRAEHVTDNFGKSVKQLNEKYANFATAKRGKTGCLIEWGREEAK